MNPEIAEEVARILLAVKAVGIAKEPFMFASGIWSPIYTDCRLLMHYVDQRERLTELIVAQIRGAGIPDVIVGTATAGIPWAAWVADRLRLPVAYVRGDAKGHGRKNQVEGIILPGQLARVVEDLISTATSCLKTVAGIQSKDAEAQAIDAIISYEMDEAVVNLDSMSLGAFPLTVFRVVVAEAAKINYFSSKAMREIEIWAAGPETWGERHGMVRGEPSVANKNFDWVDA